MPTLTAAEPTVPARTRDVTLVNMSRYVLTLVAYEGADPRHELPPSGTVVLPRDTIRFQVPPQPGSTDEVTASFVVIRPDGTVLPHGYRLAIGADRLGAVGRDTRSTPELLELHLTRDDIVLRNAATPQCG